MNIEQARAIDLEALLGQLGHTAVANKGRAHEAWFRSPFRNERTASFKVDRRTNRWKDFAEAFPGGDTINFMRHYAERQGWGSWDTARALEELERLTGGVGPAAVSAPPFRPYPTAGHKSVPPDALSPRYRLDSTGPLRSRALQDYLDSRQLRVDLARTYLQEVHYYDTQRGRALFGLGWANESGGYETRNPYFKTCLGPKDLSVVRVRGAKTRPGVALFEGMLDFLSYLQLAGREPLATAVVLNSTAMYQRAIAYCEAHHVAGTPLVGYLQNDRPGLETARRLREALPELELENHKYVGFGDVNDFLVGKPLGEEQRTWAAAYLDQHFPSRSTPQAGETRPGYGDCAPRKIVGAVVRVGGRGQKR